MDEKRKKEKEELRQPAIPSVKEQLQAAFKPSGLARIAILGALSFLLMTIFQISMPFAPEFMKVDFGDMPALLGGFAMGPVAGVIIQFLKNLLHLFTTHTFGIGELSNFIIGAVFTASAAAYYERHKTKKGAVRALVIGSLSMTLAAFLSNTFFIFPAYARAASLDLDEMARLVGKSNGLVNNYMSLMLFAVVPFNLVKTALESLATFLLYKRVSPVLHR